MDTTLSEYREATGLCRDIFLKKTVDYGTSWRVLRMISIADQLFIKAQRIRTIQQNGKQMVADDVAGEFRAIVNYGVIGLIQLEIGNESVEDLSENVAGEKYDTKMAVAEEVMLAKNYDYGEAWRHMTQESFADLILVKLLRIRQILANEGRTLISEGIDSNLLDIINYAVFALIGIAEGRH